MNTPETRFHELADRIVAALSPIRTGAKRRTSSGGIEKWYPYYAGYSLEFAEAVLRAASLREGATVLDPWNGSGTTTLAAARLGLRGRGVDLNPFAVLIARARLVNSEDAKGIRGFVREAGRRASQISHDDPLDPLRRWLAKSQVAEFRRLQLEILTNFASPNGNVLSISADIFPPLASFLLLALVRAARSLVRERTTSNPTVFQARVKHPRATGTRTLAHAWLDTASAMGEELPLTSITPVEPCVVLGDARGALAADGSVDFVLTSPPYCTRLDYGDATHFELAAAAPTATSDFATFRRDLMGAPLVRQPGRPSIPEGWPISVRHVLDSIRSHRSKASDSYYFKTYHQYFSDALASLHSIAACLKTGGAVAIVVQTSYYKEIKIELPSLYVDLAEVAGLRAKVAHKMPVRTVMSSIHPGTKTYRKTWGYDESVVLMWRN